MQKARERYIYIATGRRGVGKTHQTCKEIEQYMALGRKVLVFDVNMEEAYAHIIPATVALQNVSKIKASSRRVLPYNADGSPMDFRDKANAVVYLLQNFTNGLLVLEDYNAYATSAMVKEIVAALTTNRHRGQDIVLHLQSIAKLSTTMWQNCNIIRVHQEEDDWDKYKTRIGKFELLRIARFIIDKQYKKNQYYFLYVNFTNSKLKGATKKQLQDACKAFLEYYPRTIKGKKTQASWIKEKTEQYLA